MTALYTALLEGETKEKLALMVCGLREALADLLTAVEADHRTKRGDYHYERKRAHAILSKEMA